MTTAGEDPPSNGAGEGRDDNGRFAKGNPGGPGGSRQRALELRQAAEEAITPDHIQAMIRKATRMGLEGNLSAMRLVFERTLGRPREAGEEAAAIAIKLPAMQTSEECATASGLILEALTSGKLSREDAKVLLDGVQLRSRTLEQVDIERRLREMEDAVAERTGKPKRTRRS